MNERERLLHVLGHLQVDRVPMVSPTQTGTVDLMKASGAFWPKANEDADLMYRLSLAAHTVAGIEGCRVPFDAAVDASAFGAVTSMETDRQQPAITGRPISSTDSLDRMEVPDPHRDGRAPVVLDAITQLREALGNESPVLGGVVSAFTLAGQLRGEGEALMELVTDPSFLKGILEKATRWDIEFAMAAVSSGADVIVMVDATASGDILGPEQYQEFALPFQKRIAKAVREAGAKSILHICGNTTPNLHLMKEAGVDGISVDQSMDMKQVKTVLGKGIATVGNVSPTTTLLFRSPEYVIEECWDCIDAGTDILAPGCGFAPETPLANMKAMVSAARMRERKVL
jgi:[methyl-Co(III) methylamine-specific corrinoid protein]:coenzyme M methyltransferase